MDIISKELLSDLGSKNAKDKGKSILIGTHELIEDMSLIYKRKSHPNSVINFHEETELEKKIMSFFIRYRIHIEEDDTLERNYDPITNTFYISLLDIALNSGFKTYSPSENKMKLAIFKLSASTLMLNGRTFIHTFDYSYKNIKINDIYKSYLCINMSNDLQEYILNKKNRSYFM